MPEYDVEVREVWVQRYRVFADTPQAAMQKACDGKGEIVDGAFCYSHNLELEQQIIDPDTVTEVAEEV